MLKKQKALEKKLQRFEKYPWISPRNICIVFNVSLVALTNWKWVYMGYKTKYTLERLF